VDAYLVLVQGDAEGTADAYLVDRGREGVGFDGEWGGLGMAGNSSIALELDGVAVGDEDRVGEAGAALGLVFDAVAPFFLVGLAAVNVGIASSAAAAATEHAAGRRYPDGSSLAEVQVVQHLIADMDLAVRQARLLVRDAAALGDAADPAALVAIMEAKVAGTEAAATVTQTALEVTGGQGYTGSLPVERHLRDARAGEVTSRRRACRPTTCSIRTTSARWMRSSPATSTSRGTRTPPTLRPSTEIGGDSRLLGMRDVDADFRTVIVTRRGSGVERLDELSGQRLALGSRDSGHAAILPLHYLKAAGVAPDEDLLVRFDTDLGKHGDTGDSEVRVVEAVAGGAAEAGALGDATWAAFRTQGHPAVADLEVAWRSKARRASPCER